MLRPFARRAALLGLAAAALAAGLAGATAAETACAFRAWSKDPDPNGLAVRAAPRADARLLARLPPPRDDGGERIAVEVGVVGSKDGWLSIDGAAFPDLGNGARRVFRGRGWVSGRLIDVAVQDERVRAAPSDGAPVLAAPAGGTGGPADESLRLVRILACRGAWIEVEAEIHSDAGAARPVRGWVTGLCPSQVTTCN